ncbi:MAG: hypothetical protein HOV80_09370 [Polyangiaceae bacterium]|nr:hypothetical protein [Polyangiaceae bacterium]
MIDLPPALAPWATELGIFDPIVATGLGGLVLRLSAAIGAMRPRSSDAHDDPDGLHDLARRGPYERLLASEWLLADEMPDEFLRRAVNNEHTFLQLAFRRPAEQRATTVLFDAGPFQLGAPRVAHIALLVVFARRAAAANAAFGWGTLQEPSTTMFDAVTGSSVLALLAAKTTRTPTDAMLERWRARLDDVAPSAHRETWIVGGPSVIEHAGVLGATPIRIDDSLEPGVSRVSVQVRPKRGIPPKLVVLELPEPKLVTRLLRDPFVATPAKREDVSETVPTARSLVLAPHGRVAFARTGNSVTAFPIPNSARAGLGRPKRVRAPGTIAALNTIRRSLTSVSCDEETRRLVVQVGKHVTQRAGHFTTEARVHAPWKPEDGAPLRALYSRSSRDPAEVAYVDPRDWLFELGGASPIQVRLVARRVLATTSFERGFAALSLDVSPTWMPDAARGSGLIILEVNAKPEVEPLEATDIVEARLAADTPRQDRGIASAIRRGETWFVHTDGRAFEVPHTFIELVVGVAGGLHEKPGLVVLGADRKTFLRHTRAATETIVESPSRVVEAALDDRATVLAFTTAARELIFFSLLRKEIVGRFQLGVEP